MAVLKGNQLTNFLKEMTVNFDKEISSKSFDEEPPTFMTDEVSYQLV